MVSCCVPAASWQWPRVELSLVASRAVRGGGAAAENSGWAGPCTLQVICPQSRPRPGAGYIQGAPARPTAASWLHRWLGRRPVIVPLAAANRFGPAGNPTRPSTGSTLFIARVVKRGKSSGTVMPYAPYAWIALFVWREQAVDVRPAVRFFKIRWYGGSSNRNPLLLARGSAGFGPTS